MPLLNLDLSVSSRLDSHYAFLAGIQHKPTVPRAAHWEACDVVLSIIADINFDNTCFRCNLPGFSTVSYSFLLVISNLWGDNWRLCK